MLGALLQEREAVGEVVEVFGDAGAAAFSSERHQQLYDILTKLYFDDQPLDGKLIAQELTRRGLWEKYGKYEFLGSLLGAVASALHVRHYAAIVHEKFLLRQLINATHRVTEVALQDNQPARDVLDYAEREIFDVTERRVSGQAAHLSALVQEVFRNIESRGQDGALTGEPTGFIEFDELTSGLQPGELIIVAGRPSMGKTALGLNMAEHLAIVEKRPALFFSLEMSRQQIAQRILCSRARVDAQRLRRGRHSNRDLEDLKRAAGDIGQAPLLVDDSADLTILELRARARMAARSQDGIRAIYVDYLQLLRAPGTESRQVEVATISRGLKALAKDLQIPVVAMAQLNRGLEDKGRHGNRPRMSDLRESGAIEQDADVIALLHREAYFKRSTGEDAAPDPGVDAENQNLAELILAKQRNGPVGTIELHWNAQYTRFDNHAPDLGNEGYVPPSPADTPF